jgi:DNA-binding transcriptional MerR regulator
MSDFRRPSSDLDSDRLPFSEAVQHLHTEPYLLRQWSRRFAPFLSDHVESEYPRYTNRDIITLSIVQTLLIQGYSDSQVEQHLTSRQSNFGSPPSFVVDPSADFRPVEAPPDKPSQDNPLVVGQNAELALSDTLHDVFGALADNQRAILSNQATVREIVGVVVQDNFNLKEENRKLRDRMLELERTIAEYQRREELRKERLESRLRALETTTGGLQQQLAQLIQVIRKKRRGWFW